MSFSVQLSRGNTSAPQPLFSECNSWETDVNLWVKGSVKTSSIEIHTLNRSIVEGNAAPIFTADKKGVKVSFLLYVKAPNHV